MHITKGISNSLKADSCMNSRIQHSGKGKTPEIIKISVIASCKGVSNELMKHRGFLWQYNSFV